MPPRGWLLSGWALLRLRAFLAFTFLFAGFQKLANPAFFNSASPYSLHAKMVGYIRAVADPLAARASCCRTSTLARRR